MVGALESARTFRLTSQRDRSTVFVTRFVVFFGSQLIGTGLAAALTAQHNLTSIRVLIACACGAGVTLSLTLPAADWSLLGAALTGAFSPLAIPIYSLVTSSTPDDGERAARLSRLLAANALGGFAAVGLSEIMRDDPGATMTQAAQRRLVSSPVLASTCCFCLFAHCSCARTIQRLLHADSSGCSRSGR